MMRFAGSVQLFSLLAGFVLGASAGCTGTSPRPCTTCEGAAGCVDLDTDSANCGACGVACAPGSVCAERQCVLRCPGGTTACDGGCVATASDPRHCGACGAACTGMQLCSSGRCVALATCLPPQVECSGRCVDTSSSVTDCGGCGRGCDGGFCVQGSCQSSCPSNFSTCSGACVDTSVDPANCGRCGNGCGLGFCADAGCVSACRAPLVECTTGCIDVKNDPLNCGTCGAACDGGFCSDGGCQPFCPAPLRTCNGACVDVQLDPSNCGACGVACDAGVCAMGQCQPRCGSGLLECSARCVDDRSDPANCGGCGVGCDGGFCAAGACRSTCPSPLTVCSAACVDTRTNPLHCGSCGTACALPFAVETTCADGGCRVARCAPGRYDCDGLAANGCESPSAACLIPISVRENGLMANDSLLMQEATGGGGTTSYGGGGLQPDNLFRRADLSDDGLVVAFISSVPLVATDTNAEADVYVRDLTTGATTQVTNSQTGLGPRLVAISGDGRFVAFESRSSNVVSPDGTESDLFLWTRATSAVRKLTAAPDGGSNGGGTFRNLSVSRDGRSVFFSTEAPRLVSFPVTNPDGAPAAYRWDDGRGLSLVRDFGVRGPCAPVLVGGSLSADGTTSTLMTSAPLLVADTNGTTDVYAVREDGGVFAASEGTMGFFDAGACPTSTAQAPAVAQWPAVSAAGDRFVFEMSKSVLGESPSAAGVLHVVARDRAAPGFIVVSPGDAGAFPNNSSRFPFIDRSGQRVSFVSNAAAVPGPPLTVFSYRCFLSELNGRQVLRITPLVGDVDAGFPACVAAKVSGNGHAVLVVTPAPLAVGDQTLDGGAADLDLYLRLLP